MSNTGATLSIGEAVNLSAMTGETYRDRTFEFVNKLKRNLVVQHWPFATALAEVLPFALETVSHTNAAMEMFIPDLNSANDAVRPKDQLSGGVKIAIYREMIYDDRIIRVPAITFTKYSHSVGNHKVKEVQIAEIMKDLKLWTDSHLTKYKEPHDFADIVELCMITFLEKGFQIYSGVSFLAGDRQYYRLAFLRGDMFVEMIVTMDDLFLWGSLSNEERKPVMC